MKPKISVIIPCYNVENYIEKCIDSIFEGTLKEIEVIAINDGSNDKTREILDKLQKKYNKLNIIHKENEGVSIARNIGLKKVKGEYIAFLDSDDWVDKDMYNKLYLKAKENDYDIVACDTTAVYPNYNTIISSNINDKTKSSEALMINSYAVLWNKIYKREILKGMEFKEGINFCEDVIFLYQLYPRVKRIGVIHQPLHFYLQREGSLTYTYDKKLYQLVDALDYIIDWYKKEKIFDKYINEIEYTYVRYLFATFIKRLAKTKDKKKFIEGYEFVNKKVKDNFPKYKRNIYLKTFNAKNVYLKHFNKIIATIIFYIERNKLN